ncbi:multi-sensor signal transduction multi-kinase [Tolypothrix tenuis PCC 7101]|uniref:histidine kinase n=2 Tax=Tolypothrix TaxID=111782 RepID=A0A1Z4MZ61_9CYAN|nr:multi-sensor signal transduction multi-kinase [Tolypothrix tenuis PCC 7101]BAZ77320.1 multi-sensor signal transduction multi-kinase [Aulosira laxa NIES-50]
MGTLVNKSNFINIVSFSDMVGALFKILGYQIEQQIYAGDRTVVYRGIRKLDSHPVILKLMRNDYPSLNEVIQFRNQYNITKNLNICGVVKPYSLEQYGNGYVLVMEDYGGVSLSHYLKQHLVGGKLPLGEFFPIAIAITITLGELHRQRIIYKDIKPANILIHPETKQIKIIDFSIASLLPRESQQIQNPNVLEGTLAYISPEQTGRMNRGIDYRTDFYSLGVTFYELLTGKLPFESADPLELVYCHIAKMPMALGNSKEIPQVLSDIVMKLMAKNAEDRYQSAAGLRYDLEHCFSQWQKNSAIAAFALGQRDISDRFLIPEKLYGRQSDVEALLQVFDRVAGNREQTANYNLLSQSELVLIAGFSGIGKTAVVNEVHKPIVRQKGYFIAGKFDQFQRNIPFFAFVQALEDLMSQILTQSDSQIADWKTKILAALGDNAEVIIDVIPELKRIIGTPQPVTELAGSAAQQRFNRLFRKFIQVFATPEHPLVIFLDDLQWADTASLQLLKMLMSEIKIRSLLIIGAYRDNEVTENHPLMLTLDELRNTQFQNKITTITLEPLTATDINHLFADSLSCTLKEALPLAKLIYQKTQGNPFFSLQMLKSLHAEGHINFAPEFGIWRYDLHQVDNLKLTDNVVEFMVQQLQKLPAATQDILKLAACIGNTFDLETLAIVYEKPLVETAANLWSALTEGLIVARSQTYKFFYQEDNTSQLHSYGNFFNGDDYIYDFLHDRVQQAAYSLIDESQKQVTHLQIGNLLLKNISGDAQEEHIFELVNHLNIGLQLITELSQKEQVVRLNLQAGCKAKAATAYATASQYLATAMQLLSDNSWLTQYELTFTIYKELAEVEYLNSNFIQSHALIKEALIQVKSAPQKAELYNLLIVQHTMQADYALAIEVGKQALSLLDIDFSDANIKYLIDAEIAEITASLANCSVISLLDAPVNTNPIYSSAIKLLISLDPPTYISSSLDLYIFVTVKATNLSIKYGNVAESAKAYVNYGFLLGSTLGDYRTGYEFGILATQIADKFHDRGQKCKVNLLLGNWLHNWSKPAHLAIAINNTGYQAGLDAGELQFAGYNLLGNICNQYFQGANLNHIRADISKFLPFTHQTKNTFISEILIEIQQVIAQLIGDSSQPSAPELQQISQSAMTLAIAHLFKAQLNYLQAQFDIALHHITQAEKYLPAIFGFTTSASYPFAHALILAALYPQASQEKQRQYWQNLINHQNQIKIWANSCPENFEHRYLLIQAEIARITNRELEAMDLYDRAIASAQIHGFKQNVALAKELAGKFWFAKGKSNIAQLYLSEAVDAYIQWGAISQVKLLEAQYPRLLKKNQNLSLLATESRQKSIISTTNINFSAQLDCAAFFKASQAIAGEIQLEQLLAILMQVMLENTGAKKCVLLLTKNQQLAIAATASFDGDKILSQTHLSAIPLETSQDIPLAAINYVKRTMTPLVIDDIASESRFASDAYIISQQPRSVLCTPILNQGELMGVLYLENQLTAGVFTRDRLEVVQLLTSQAAISLENAQLYTDLSQTTAELQQVNTQLAAYSHTLEAKVAERTAQLNAQTQELETAFKNLQTAQMQLIQNEKMSALGQLVAGIAHEINNPISFIFSNLSPATEYINDLIHVLQCYRQQYPQPTPQLQEQIADVELDFITLDLQKILHSMEVGAERIRNIVVSLRNFSRLDEAEIKAVDIHEGIDSTLMILQNLLQAKSERPEILVSKQYGKLPLIECYAGQLNQVFMNLIMNAIEALDDAMIQGKMTDNPQICIRTELDELDKIKIYIADNGIGINDSIKPYLFDPFFTTKQVGKGTGLGLSISYQIIVDKHQGILECQSTPGAGAEFVITLPIRRTRFNLGVDIENIYILESDDTL